MGFLTQEEINVDLFDEVKRLQQQNRELVARIGEFKSFVRSIDDYLGDEKTIDRTVFWEIVRVSQVMEDSGSPSLAGVESAAIEAAKQSFVHFCHLDDIPENKMDAFEYGLDAYEKHLTKYAANLREGK